MSITVAKSHPCDRLSQTTWKKTSCNTSLLSASYININHNIWSTVADAYTPESMRISRKPLSPQSWPIDEIKQHCVWKPPSRIVWLFNSSGKCHINCFAITYSCWSIACTENDWPSACDISVHFFMTDISEGLSSTIGAYPTTVRDECFSVVSWPKRNGSVLCFLSTW